MRKVPAALFGSFVLAAFTFAAWSMLAAVAATPAAALMAISCPGSCSIAEENCVANAVCVWDNCTGLGSPYTGPAPDLGIAPPAGCTTAPAEPATPDLLPGAPAAPAESVGQCAAALSAGLFQCQVQGAVCDIACVLPPSAPPRAAD